MSDEVQQSSLLRGIVSARYPDGRVAVFGTTQELYVWCYEGRLHPRDGRWSGGWRRFHAEDNRLVSLAAGANQDGRVHVYGVDPNAGLWNTWQTSVNGGWSEWRRFHGEDNRLGRLAAGINQDGRQEVVGIGTPGSSVPWHTWQKRPNVDWDPWYPLMNGPQLKNHAIAQSYDRLVVAGPELDGRLVFTGQKRPNGEWTEWGRVGDEDIRAVTVSMTKGDVQNPTLYAVDENGVARSAHTADQDHRWSPFERVAEGRVAAGTVFGTVEPPSTREHVFAIGADGIVQGIAGSFPDQKWQPLGEPLRATHIAPEAAPDGQGGAIVVCIAADADGALWAWNRRFPTWTRMTGPLPGP